MDPAATLKLLADPTRLAIMLLLATEKELCVCELVAALDESQPKISRHLRLLKDARLICDRRQGQWMFYAWAQELPDWAAQLLDNLRLQYQPQTWQQLARVEQMPSRPERCC
ncbi:transcriptional regulator [Aliidiomarina sedimenti]|uniref:Transcriptional regulator n=1 Tax=Aliidiomarina sedimenti TaxID=1933879 RepID=A0ABY0BZL1_9GAMM|nr:metalloregulator ArsR/SmtB family transcription factor [Aliidiomarina sedimenti]RUO29972.1 transcriptional regulator [Aliidiomarina sedimenti]